MSKYLWAMLAGLALAVVAAKADDIMTPEGFRVSGDGVKVIQVVQTFPFTVTAPPVSAAAFRYQWDLPSGVTATGVKTKTITVTAAPNNLTLSVSFGVVDFDKKTVDDKEFATTIYIAGPEPKPGPVVDQALLTSLQTAYAAETDQGKATQVAALAALTGSIVDVAKASGAVKTNTDFQVAVKKATDLAIGTASLPKVRPAIGAYVSAALPTQPGQAVNDDFWNKAATAYGNVAAVLKAVK